MSPPYPRVAPTYKQLDESELIKLNLLLFIPVERTVWYLLYKLNQDQWVKLDNMASLTL
jgi:hypothetical protein